METKILKSGHLGEGADAQVCLSGLAAEVVSRVAKSMSQTAENVVELSVYAAHGELAQRIVDEWRTAVEVETRPNGKLAISVIAQVPAAQSAPSLCDSVPAEIADEKSNVDPDKAYERHFGIAEGRRRRRQHTDDVGRLLSAEAARFGFPKSDLYGKSVIVPTMAVWAKAYASINKVDGKDHPQVHRRALAEALNLQCTADGISVVGDPKLKVATLTTDSPTELQEPDDWDVFINFLEKNPAFPKIRYRSFCPHQASWYYPLYISWRLSHIVR